MYQMQVTIERKPITFQPRNKRKPAETYNPSTIQIVDVRDGKLAIEFEGVENALRYVTGKLRCHEVEVLKEVSDHLKLKLLNPDSLRVWMTGQAEDMLEMVHADMLRQQEEKRLAEEKARMEAEAMEAEESFGGDDDGCVVDATVEAEACFGHMTEDDFLLMKTDEETSDHPVSE